MKFKILASDLKAVMTVAGSATSKDNSSPILKAVNCRLTENRLIATGIDGYKMHQISVPCEVTDADDQFGDFNIRPIKEVRSGMFNYSLEVNDDYISYLDEDSNMKIEMPLMPGTFLKIEDILPKTEIVFSICMDPKMLQETLKLYNKEQKIRLDFYSNNSPVLIHAKDSKAMIMPVRYTKGGDSL